MPECLVPFHKAVMVHVVCRCGVEHACLSATSADTDRTQAIPAPPPTGCTWTGGEGDPRGGNAASAPEAPALRRHRFAHTSAAYSCWGGGAEPMF